MPEIKSFKGVFFNSEKIKIEDAVSPPYDVISPRMQDSFYNKSNVNIVRLILSKEESNDNEVNNKYTRAATTLDNWLKDEVLVYDKDSSIYYLEEIFYVNGERKKRKGFIALSKLEDFSKGNILPHEKTMHGPKADRLKLTKLCKCNFSQIFSVYSDDTGNSLKYIDNPKPIFNLNYDNVEYRFGKVTDSESIKKLTEIMKDKKIFIADGHHRYETALAYRDYRRKIDGNPSMLMPYDFVMMYFSPIEHNDLLILPTHRGVKNVNIHETDLIKKLSEYFHIDTFDKKELSKILSQMKSLSYNDTLFTAYFGGEKCYMLTFNRVLKEKLNEYESLDVQILQKFILEKCLLITQEDLDNKTKIEYIKDIEYGLELLESGELNGIFFMNSTKIEQVKNIALSGKKMPQKSTYFYPKLLTGLVIYKIE